ncbi:hypothetical protein TNIN_487461 [Trichonephila inaurata madagascariensis]|uniref:Uncharacterized protein n=1 Tax=Trichonephila inaurata madagascariensis TaxID=2747483 RepID=A0A8X7CTF9_9ARAC|nr:hypothetical protein TNIN_487461 [Trichonephila inaurata madagascariensis]
MVALCIVLLTMQSVEMKPATRERRQSVTQDGGVDLVVRILKAIFDGISLRKIGISECLLSHTVNQTNLERNKKKLRSLHYITIKTLEITMKTYFFVMMALCIALLVVQSVEMVATRERRQSSNNSTMNAGDLAVAILREIFRGISLRNLLGK